MFRFLFGLYVFLGVCSSSVSAQEKFEKESRIKKKDIPERAKHFIDSLQLQVKVKWYKEETLNQESIEAKYKLQDTHYSIEFNKEGLVEDVEKEIVFEQLVATQKKSITNSIEKECSKYVVKEVQRQYTGCNEELLAFLINGTTTKPLTVKYEVVVKCTHAAGVNLFEYLFSDEGLLLSKQKIVFKNSSHLEY